jgi:type II secretory pathway pseudopilin PulG
MRHPRPIRRAQQSQSGYALLLIIFFLALLVISLAAAAPTVLSNIQREREAEMVWRGKQYTRGIRLYYLKLNRFPTSLDDLTKPKTGIRFMRQAYKDPMNQVDGSWRLIYVGPNGQLIGSLSDRSIGMNGMGAQGGGGLPGAGSSLLSSGSGSGLTNTSTATLGSSGFGASQTTGISQGGAVGTAMGNGSSTSSTSTPGNGSFEDPGQPHSLGGMMDASNTIGGNIIGVGSKVDKKSFRVYEKAKNYKLFEFIWDPSKDTTAGRASVGIGSPVQNGNGTSPAGTSPSTSPFSSGMNPTQSPSQNPGSGTNPSQGSNPAGNPDPNQTPPLQAPPNQ